MTFLSRFSWLLLPLAFACAADKTPAINSATVDVTRAARDASWELMYSDRSANGFHFWLVSGTAHFRYDPVEPIMSNSGIYSGGAPSSGTLTSEQLATLRGLLDALAENTEAHVAQRTKGTGSVQIIEDGTVRSFLISAHALDDLESFLAGFRGSAPQMLPSPP